jgi:hypothetical protein
VPDVSVIVEAGSAQNDVFAHRTFVHVLAVLDFGKLASLAIIVVGYADLLRHLLMLLLGLLFAQLHDQSVVFIVMFVPAKWAGDLRIGLSLMLSPLFEAAQVETVLAHPAAGGYGVVSDYLLLTDCTNILIVLFIFFHDDVVAAQVRRTHVLQELADFVEFDAAAGHHKA